jgi:hypothetical protein
MKTFNNPIHQKEYTNEHGEKMTMIVDRNCVMWIHHEDCNKDFERATKFNYILNKGEVNAIQEFAEEAEKKVKELFGE